jgi:hypothetical protein
MTPKGADLEATDLIEVSTIESGSYVTRSITGQELIDAIPLPPTGLTVGTTPISSGTIGRVLFQGTGNVLQQSSSLFWDSTNNRLGIGTSTPTFRLEVQGGDVRFANGLTIGTAGSAGWQFSSNTVTLIQNGFVSVDFANGREFSFTNASFSTTYLKLASVTGNVLINTTTDAGFRLDVNGTARVSGALTLNNTSGTNRSTDIRLTNSIDNFPAATFYPASGTNVGQNFQIIPRGTGLSANVKAQFVLSGTDTIADGTNFEAMVIRATGAAFTLISGKGGTGTIRPLLLSSGFLDGSTNPNQLWLYSSGNIGINTTTDAGFKTDINGTLRVQGALTVLGNGTIFSSTNNTWFHSASGGVSTIDYFNGFVIQNAAQAVFKTAYNGNSRFLRESIFGTDGANNASAQLQIDSTTKGFLPPRMTTTQRNAIASPAAGLVVYDNTDNKHYGYNGTTWNAFY